MKHHEKVQCSFSELPFKTTLSFEYLVAEIDKIAGQNNHPMNEPGKKLQKELEKVPALKEAICDSDIIKDNRELVNRMMALIFNPLEDDINISSAGAPFSPESFYFTSLFKEKIHGEHRIFEATKSFDENDRLITLIYQAYLIIFKQYFGFEFDINVPFTYKVTDTRDNSIKYYKMLVNPKYVELKVHGKIKKISQDELNTLFDNTSNLDYWNEKIPLDKFEFRGFLQFTYIDVTHDYVVSQLKTILLDKNSIISQDGFSKIKEKIRALLEIPDMEFGLSAFSEFNSDINQDVIWKSLLPRSAFNCHDYADTIFERAYMEKNIVITEDFEKLEQDKMTSLFLELGIRNHAVIPLMLEDEIVGMMEIGSKKPDQINMFQIKRLYELFPVFAIALKRSKEELEDRIRAIIQEEFTAIHPTVEWRFYEAAHGIHSDQQNAQTPQMEPIIFNDVVPIYGASDIRGSSIERNNAIQSDLMEHLGMAKKILMNCMPDKEMPLLEHLTYKVDLHLKTVKKGLKAGDEVSILEFLKREIEPVFSQLKDRESADKDLFSNYFAKMDPELKVLYKKRKDFEDSLTMINDIVGEIIDHEQTKAQEVYPHYFEKYRTDGVEYNAYIGQSLVKNVTYDKIYLKNIRLWQLLVKVKVARKIRESQADLKTKLDITQLILVHSNPLSITFRQDEKKFDVAGAYNIRYEITKKRIDKAMINGTNERVTQVGKIAIIYSHAEEIEEYKKYIDYLISKKYIKETVEELELEDLKGASGLRALRVEVNFDSLAEHEDIVLDEIKKVVEQV